MVYGELGKYKLESIVANRMLMFWYRLVHGKEGKISCVLYSFHYSLFNSGVHAMGWIQKIKNLLDGLGFSDLWRNQASNIGLSLFKSIVTKRLNDMNSQDWHCEVNANPQCVVYRIFKHTLIFEKYLLCLGEAERKLLCRFRCLNNKLPIVIGRYAHVPRCERLCTQCSLNLIGDEFHYLFECPAFEESRRQALKSIFGNILTHLKWIRFLTTPIRKCSWG